MWKSRPEVMRETGVLFKGQQPKDETTKVKEFLEEGDDPGPKMRSLDSCPLPLSPKCFIPQSGISSYKSSADSCSDPALTLDCAWPLESISRPSALLTSSSLGNLPRDCLYLLRLSHSLDHLLLAELPDHISPVAVPVLLHRHSLSSWLGINSLSHPRGTKLTRVRVH